MLIHPKKISSSLDLLANPEAPRRLTTQGHLRAARVFRRA
jgi:hypothetical protein